MDVLQLADLGFTVILSLTILVILYAMSMISREIRLIQYNLGLIETDLKLIGEEINTLASRDFPNQGKKQPPSEGAPKGG